MENICSNPSLFIVPQNITKGSQTNTHIMFFGGWNIGQTQYRKITDSL